MTPPRLSAPGQAGRLILFASSLWATALPAQTPAPLPSLNALKKMSLDELMDMQVVLLGVVDRLGHPGDVGLQADGKAL